MLSPLLSLASLIREERSIKSPYSESSASVLVCLMSQWIQMTMAYPEHSMYKGTRLSLSEVTPDMSKIPDLLRSYTQKRKIRNCSSNGEHLIQVNFSSKFNFYRWQWSVLLPQLPWHQVCVWSPEVSRGSKASPDPNLPQIQWGHWIQETKPWQLLWNFCWAPQPSLWGEYKDYFVTFVTQENFLSKVIVKQTKCSFSLCCKFIII